MVKKEGRKHDEILDYYKKSRAKIIAYVSMLIDVLKHDTVIKLIHCKYVLPFVQQTYNNMLIMLVESQAMVRNEI